MKKKSNVLISVIIFLAIICLIVIILFIKGIGNVKNMINSYIDEKNKSEEIYNNIKNELVNNNIITSNLKYVGLTYALDGEFVDESDRYYFYIDENIYDSYKNYWLEDVDKTQFKDDFNKKISSEGDYVFHAVNISEVTYLSSSKYKNINLDANKKYFIVKLYDEALYYKYIFGYVDKNNYGIADNFYYNSDSLIKEYVFSLENDKLIFDEVVSG